jgi:hypothetical protein
MRLYRGIHYFTQGVERGFPWFCQRACRAQVEGNFIRINFDDVDARNGFLEFTGQPGERFRAQYGYGQEHTGEYELARHNVGDDQLVLTGVWQDPSARGTPKYGGWTFILTPEPARDGSTQS